MPAFALCPIEGGESVCTIPDVKQPFNSMFLDKTNSSIGSNSERLQPKTKENPIDNMRGQNSKINNSSTCAFGSCLNDTTTNKRLRNTHP